MTTTTPATEAQIRYARTLQAASAELMSYDGAEEAWIDARAGQIRIAILQGSLDRAEYAQARDDLAAAQAGKAAAMDELFGHLDGLARLAAQSRWSRTQPRTPDPVQAAALAQATADWAARQADVTVDPATLSTTEASALIDRIR